MKTCLVSYFDKDLQSFSTLQAIQCPTFHDLKVDLKRGIAKQFPLEKLGQFAGQIIYCKGYFDNETGELTLTDEEGLDLDSLLVLRKDYVDKVKEAAQKDVN